MVVEQDDVTRDRRDWGDSGGRTPPLVWRDEPGLAKEEGCVVCDEKEGWIVSNNVL